MKPRIVVNEYDTKYMDQQVIETLRMPVEGRPDSVIPERLFEFLDVNNQAHVGVIWVYALGADEHCMRYSGLPGYVEFFNELVKQLMPNGKLSELRRGLRSVGVQ